LNAGKLKARADEGQFVGFDEESKGYCIYWPSKKRVSIEWDMYFDKDQALQPEEVQIKGEWNMLTDPTTTQPHSCSEPEKSIESMASNPAKPTKPKIIENETQPPVPPHLKKTR